MKLVTHIFGILLLWTVASVTFGYGASASETLLRDGFLLKGAEGRLAAADSNETLCEDTDRWFFEFDSAVSDGRSQLEAGARLEVLPSAALEQMALDAKRRSDPRYRLFAQVTKYKGSNYIFPTYFLLVRKVVEPQQEDSKPQPQVIDAESDTLGTAVNEANDVLPMPAELSEKLDGSRVILSERPVQRPAVRRGGKARRDSVLPARVGFIQAAGCKKCRPWEEFGFVFDAFGWNLPAASVKLLPCEALESAAGRKRDGAKQLDPVRLKIFGLVTEYKGRRYMLLRRTTPVYSYGNFAR